MKLRQFSLFSAGILWLGGTALKGGISDFTNVAGATTPSDGSGAEAVAEWYGPFSSWDNVKSKYGAKGDGKADDTAALNNALASVGLSGNSPVLYFPNGTYRVTAKLLLRNRRSVEIVGQSRDGVVLRYDGATDSSYSGPSTLFHADGVNESHFARLTFDGNGKSKTIVSESQTSGAQYFDSGNSWEDCVFQNAVSGGHGVDAGYYDQGFAGINFLRCIFKNLAAGIITWNWNALDGWATDSYFEHCDVALLVHTGSLHAYHSAFVNNGTDFLLEPGANFISMVSNVSYHAGAFFKANNTGANTTHLLLKGNTVIDPTGNVAIVMGSIGPLVMLDNVIANTNGAAVSFSNSLQADFLALGNTNVVSSWYTVGGGSGLKANLVDNFVVSRNSLNLPGVPPLPTPAVNLNRTVVNMASSFAVSDLQNAINSAADGTVIHVPYGSHGLDQTISIPINKDVRIVGDGQASSIDWGGSDGGTLFSLPHPSRATFSHVKLYGDHDGKATLISVNGVGSSAARVYLRDVSLMRGINANIRVGDCPNAVVDLYARGSFYTAVTPSHGNSILLEGRGKVKYINTEGGVHTLSYVCTNGGNLYVESAYDEAGDTSGSKILLLSGGGTATFLSGKFVANIGSNGQNFGHATRNGFAVVGFTGQLLMSLADGIIDWYNIAGATTGNLWIQGSSTHVSPVASWPIINSTAAIPVQTMNWSWNDGDTRYSDVGTASAAYTRQMFSPARAEYSDRSPMARRLNQTDVLLEHVFFELGKQNLWLKP